MIFNRYGVDYPTGNFGLAQIEVKLLIYVSQRALWNIILMKKKGSSHLFELFVEISLLGK
jgi:hypothetical protein